MSDKTNKPSHGWVLIIAGGGASNEDVPQFWDWDDLCAYAWEAIGWHVNDDCTLQQLVEMTEFPPEFIKRCDVKAYGLEYECDNKPDGPKGPFLAALPWHKWFQEAQDCAKEVIESEKERRRRKELTLSCLQDGINGSTGRSVSGADLKRILDEMERIDKELKRG